MVGMNQLLISIDFIKDNYLKTSETSGYTVERISKDTLILCERIDGQQNDRLKCYHLIREETLNLNFLQKYQGKKTDFNSYKS